MPNNDTPISSFQDATGINEADKVTGLKNGVNTNFSFSTILSWFVTTVAAAFVPVSRKVNNKALSADISLDASDVGAQAAITASGILKGDGAGGVSAAVAGMDYGTYSKPSGGIPSSDMTSAVQTSLGKADSAYQKPSGGIPASDLANGVIPSVPSPSDSTPQALGTAAAGSSGNYSRADHVHQKPSASDVGAIPTSEKGANGGVATLGNDGKVPSAQLPPISAEGKADEDTIALTESSTTASAAHPLGSTFYLNGILYRALSDIAIGGTINTGTGGNATQTKISENFKRTVTLTSAQYAQLSAAEKAADIVYIVTDDNAVSSEDVDYDNTGSGLAATNAQDAVDELAEEKASQSQLAYVETGSTASRAYAVGEYFCWNGLLYRAKTAISSGASFTVGTNCEQLVGGGLNDIGTSISTIAAVSGNTTIQIGGYYKIGYVVIFTVAIQASKNLASGDNVCQGLPGVRANNVALRFYNHTSQTFGDAILINTGVITLKSSVSSGQSIRLTGAYIA